jgi:hypothetical protein
MRITSPPLILAINGAVAAAEFAVIAPVTANAPEFTAASVEVPDADSVVNAPAAGVPAPTVPLIFIEAVPVKFVTIPLLGVPRAGVTKTGLVANTFAPDPVSSVSAVANCAEVNEPSDAALPTDVIAPVRFALVVVFPAVRPAAVPVMFVPTKADGVPNAGVTRVGLVANTKEPVPVSPVTADAKLAEDGVVKKVVTPVPKPATPVEIGNPVALVNTPDEGVPRAGVTKVGLVFKTLLPVPVELVTPVPPCATVTVAACFTSLPVVPLKATKPSAVAEAGPTTSPVDPATEASSFTVPAAFLK